MAYLKCLHVAPILLLRNWAGVDGSAAFPPIYLLKGCVTASIHHPDTGALIETARPDPVSAWGHICHSPRWGVCASYHCHRSTSLKHTHPLTNIRSNQTNLSISHNAMIQLMKRPRQWCSDIDTDMGVPLDTTSPAPPGGNGGRKNVEGGSKFPPGTLLDGEAERWTDDNGREARAWESPRGDLHPATCWLRLLNAKCTEPRPSQQIWQGDPFTETPAVLFLPSLTPNQEVMSWHRGCRQVWDSYLHHYQFVSSLLWRPNHAFCQGSVYQSRSHSNSRPILQI